MQHLIKRSPLNWEQRDAIADRASIANDLLTSIGYLASSARSMNKPIEDDPVADKRPDSAHRIEIRGTCLAWLYDEISPVLDDLDKAVPILRGIDLDGTRECLKSIEEALCDALTHEHEPAWNSILYHAEDAHSALAEAAKELLDLDADFARDEMRQCAW